MPSINQFNALFFNMLWLFLVLGCEGSFPSQKTGWKGPASFIENWKKLPENSFCLYSGPFKLKKHRDIEFTYDCVKFSKVTNYAMSFYLRTGVIFGYKMDLCCLLQYIILWAKWDCTSHSQDCVSNLLSFIKPDWILYLQTELLLKKLDIRTAGKFVVSLLILFNLFLGSFRCQIDKLYKIFTLYLGMESSCDRRWSNESSSSLVHKIRATWESKKKKKDASIK